MDEFLAHSARDGYPAQSYNDHVRGVTVAAIRNARRAVSYYAGSRREFIDDVRAAAVFHDLGKLDDENQEVLRGQSQKALPVAHDDAGVAALTQSRRLEGAVISGAHHAGLFSKSEELGKQGRPFRRLEVADHVDTCLPAYCERHGCSRISVDPASSSRELHGCGLRRRIALSCLVDADHSDTARHYGRECLPIAAMRQQWPQRLAALEQYVFNLPEGNSKREKQRNHLRRCLFKACMSAATNPSFMSCEAPVGSGKTTAVMAHLLRAAIDKGLRHIIVVAPYTNIIQQTVNTYRKALVLPGENPEDVIAEHHHQADFSSFECRHLASLWKSPIIVTTAVQFFETIGSNHPSRLRKLHELPGTAVFVDEMHAAMPSHLWPQAWRWLRTLAERWNGHIVLGSGSLASFWKLQQYRPLLSIDGDTADVAIPDLLDGEDRLRAHLADAEHTRITYKRREIADAALNCDDLIGFVAEKPGPRLLIVNTVQTAATVAQMMRKQKMNVLHLSTALAPVHRGPILNEVKRRLECPRDSDWTLVATSCVEAGVDLSFRTGVRERASLSSLIQTGGRVNRSHHYSRAEVWDVLLRDERFSSNPALDYSRQATSRFTLDEINSLSASILTTRAMNEEWSCGVDAHAKEVLTAEKDMEYPEVARLFRVIDSDTQLVVVEPRVAEILAHGGKIGYTLLLKNSVQLWSNRIMMLGLSPIESNDEVYQWNLEYDSTFLGIMAGILSLEDFCRNGGAVI